MFDATSFNPISFSPVSWKLAGVPSENISGGAVIVKSGKRKKKDKNHTQQSDFVPKVYTEEEMSGMAAIYGYPYRGEQETGLEKIEPSTTEFEVRAGQILDIDSLHTIFKENIEPQSAADDSEYDEIQLILAIIEAIG